MNDQPGRIERFSFDDKLYGLLEALVIPDEEEIRRWL
jgi:hypothetical protein